MKELSVNEKAKRYDEAIKRIEDIKTGKCETIFMFTEGLFEHIFPELAESEDERIRKEILDYIDKATGCQRWITWLEKQGEIKEINYDEELKKCKANPLYFFDKYVKVKLKEQKPAWSEEDEKMLDTVIDDFVKLAGPKVCYYKDVDWLKSIKKKLRKE